ncbi:MAG: patatin-like phospholipase family protein [Bryobacterales bacterium]|nr:patatin-like phospholipase family protein [Bryobacterales bacterium]
MKRTNPLRVISIDRGGMRRLYSAAYLAKLAKSYEKTREAGLLDIGKGFDLIAAASTGAIVGCALAVGVAADRVASLYRDYGHEVFSAKLPREFGIQTYWAWLKTFFRASHLRAGTSSLRKAFDRLFGKSAVASIWKNRGSALAIPSVNMASHRAWVVKTPHLPNSRRRDENTAGQEMTTGWMRVAEETVTTPLGRMGGMQWTYR